MKILFNVLLILVVVIFLPIPIKISLYFNKSGYDIKLYKFSLVESFKKKLSKKDTEDTKKASPKKEAKAKKKKEAKDEGEKFNLFKFLKARIDTNILYTNFRLSHFKPRLRVNGFLNYSLGDPMNTALSYGAVNMVLPLFYRGILLFFRTKKFKFDINPLLESESHLNTKLDCIIFFSIAHIMYMLFLIFKSILDTREVNPL